MNLYTITLYSGDGTMLRKERHVPENKFKILNSNGVMILAEDETSETEDGTRTRTILIGTVTVELE